MNITYIAADKPHEWNSAEWRAALPVRAVNRTKKHRAKLGHIEHFAGNTPYNEQQCEDADIIVLQRGAMPETWASVEHWRRRGKVILTDLDDGYPQITPEHPAYQFWHTGLITMPDGRTHQLPRPAIHDMAEGLTKVNGLISPSRLILEDWKSHQPRGEYIPNYAETWRYTRYKRTRSPEDDGTIWIAWGGSFGHFVSFQRSGILYGLARAMSRYPHVRFVMCGADERIVNAMPLKDSQKIHINWQPNDLWLQTLINFDVGLIPCAGEFDARRSWLKPLEYSLMRVPWIASETPAYHNLGEFGTVIDNTADAWAQAVTDAIEHGSDERRVKRGWEWAMRQDIDSNMPGIINTLKGFLP